MKRCSVTTLTENTTSGERGTPLQPFLGLVVGYGALTVASLGLTGVSVFLFVELPLLSSEPKSSHVSSLCHSRYNCIVANCYVKIRFDGCGCWTIEVLVELCFFGRYASNFAASDPPESAGNKASTQEKDRLAGR